MLLSPFLQVTKVYKIMLYTYVIKRLVLVSLLLLLLFSSNLPFVGLVTANAATLPSRGNISPALNSPSLNNWYEIDKRLADAVREVHDTTEEFATAEMDEWLSEIMKKVDNQFLNWYFSYFHQKATQDGVPFAWLAFKIDFLKVLRAEDEKQLNADQIIQKRMIEEINDKFKQLVFNQETEDDLKRTIERIARNYASAIGFKFSQIKALYQVHDEDWKQHLDDISQLIYNTGTSQFGFSTESLNNQLATKLSIATTLAISTKLAAKFASKLVVKGAVKGGVSAAAELVAKFVDPFILVGFLAWDVSDYQQMITKTQPELRQNIFDYLNELKQSIINSPENSIMTAIEEVETKLINTLDFHNKWS